MVYFIQCNDDVKIGYSADVKQRLRALQTGNPTMLTLLATMKGDRTTEAYLHNIFASDRIQGEWFRLSQHIHDFMVTSCDLPAPGEDRVQVEQCEFELELANKLLVSAAEHTFKTAIYKFD